MIICFMTFCSYFMNAISSFVPLKILNSFMSKFTSVPYTVSASVFWVYFYDCMFWFLSASLGTFLKYLSVFGTHKHIKTSMCGSGLKTKDFTVRPPDTGFRTLFFCLLCQVPWDEFLNLFLGGISLVLVYPPEGVYRKKYVR